MNPDPLPPLDPGELQSLLERFEVTQPYPFQLDAIQAFEQHANLIVSAPTASGKSLVAYYALLRHLRARRRAIYVSPSIALSREKYEDLRKATANDPWRVRFTVGLSEQPLKPDDVDVLLTTTEKLDSLIKKDNRWLQETALLVVDEIHLLADANRGPLLEYLLTLFRKFNPACRLLALSATVTNGDALAAWLGAHLLQSDWRPVPIRKGLLTPKRIRIPHQPDRDEPAGDPAEWYVKRNHAHGGQTLVFVARKDSAMKLAETLGQALHEGLDAAHRARLAELARPLAQRKRSTIATRLAKAIQNGASFHTGDLSLDQRRLVEDAFRKDRLLRVLVATPTLEAGVNLPSRHVLVRDWKRFSAEAGGMQPISNISITQQLGRAGRPPFDTWGEALVYVPSRDEEERVLRYYILGPVDPIESKFNVDSHLRTVLLGLLQTGFASTRDDLLGVLRSTFHYTQRRDDTHLGRQVNDALRLLRDHEFIQERHGVLSATPFGTLVSRLCIDPLTAIRIEQALLHHPHATPFQALQVLAHTPQLARLKFGLNKGERERLHQALAQEGHAQLPLHELFRQSLEESEQSAWLARILLAHMEETPAEDLEAQEDVTPGFLHNFTTQAEWIAYAAQSIARLRGLNFPPDVADRVRYGVRAELLPLVRLKGVGRVRARILYEAGYRTPADVQAADPQALQDLPEFGELTVRTIQEAIAKPSRMPAAVEAA